VQIASNRLQSRHAEPTAHSRLAKSKTTRSFSLIARTLLAGVHAKSSVTKRLALIRMPQTPIVADGSAIRLVELSDLPLVPQLTVLKHSVQEEFALTVRAHLPGPAKTKTFVRKIAIRQAVVKAALRIIVKFVPIIPYVPRAKCARKPLATDWAAGQFLAQ